MTELMARWTLIAFQLREAALALPAQQMTAVESNGVDPAGSLVEFEEFLSHNELELAWESLAELAEGRRDTVLVWFHLAEAATLMELPNHKERAVRRMVETWPARDSPYRLGYVRAKPDARPVSA